MFSKETKVKDTKPLCEREMLKDRVDDHMKMFHEEETTESQAPVQSYVQETIEQLNKFTEPKQQIEKQHDQVFTQLEKELSELTEIEKQLRKEAAENAQRMALVSEMRQLKEDQMRKNVGSHYRQEHQKYKLSDLKKELSELREVRENQMHKNASAVPTPDQKIKKSDTRNALTAQQIAALELEEYQMRKNRAASSFEGEVKVEKPPTTSSQQSEKLNQHKQPPTKLKELEEKQESKNPDSAYAQNGSAQLHPKTVKPSDPWKELQNRKLLDENYASALRELRENQMRKNPDAVFAQEDRSYKPSDVKEVSSFPQYYTSAPELGELREKQMVKHEQMDKNKQTDKNTDVVSAEEHQKSEPSVPKKEKRFSRIVNDVMNFVFARF